MRTYGLLALTGLLVVVSLFCYAANIIGWDVVWR